MRSSAAFLQTTHQKTALRIALLISAVIHGAALLWVRFDPFDVSPPTAIPTIEVTLITAPPDEDLVSEEVVDHEPMPPPLAPEVPQSPRDDSKLPEQGVAPSAMEPADAEPAEPIDWEDIISTYAEEATIQNLEHDRHRDTMWQKTHSVMFTPPEDWLIEDKPYLPDLQFEADKAKRLGIKISENCYLGFPGIDPQTVDSDAPGWSGGGAPQPTVKLITCGFGG